MGISLKISDIPAFCGIWEYGDTRDGPNIFSSLVSESWCGASSSLTLKWPFVKPDRGGGGACEKWIVSDRAWADWTLHSVPSPPPCSFLSSCNHTTFHNFRNTKWQWPTVADWTPSTKRLFLVGRILFLICTLPVRDESWWKWQDFTGWIASSKLFSNPRIPSQSSWEFFLQLQWLLFHDRLSL